MKRLTLFCCLVGLLTALPISGQKKAAGKKFFTSGFFDGIEMTSKESGDYGGIAVFLTQTENDTYALVSIAEGVEADPVLVPVKVSGKTGRTVEFTYDTPSYGRKLLLKGTVRPDGLMLSGYGERSLIKRRCADAYSSISVGKESGDYGGMEVYLGDAGGTWYALVTLAEGVINAPVLVPAEVTGKNYDKISFTLPGDRKFTGRLDPKGRTLTINEQGTTSVLRRKCYQ